MLDSHQVNLPCNLDMCCFVKKAFGEIVVINTGTPMEDFVILEHFNLTLKVFLIEDCPINTIGRDFVQTISILFIVPIQNTSSGDSLQRKSTSEGITHTITLAHR